MFYNYKYIYVAEMNDCVTFHSAVYFAYGKICSQM